MEDKKSKFNDEDIQAKLDKRLGPEYISKRVGFGSSRVAYIEGWRAINLANQIFGYNGWSTEVKTVVVDFLDDKQGKYSIGCTAIVRVTLSNGTFREDIGYGTVENERRKAAAFERAKKSAVTDALKRSLRGFGNALGNCLYDKEFLSRIDKVKFDPPDFDEGNLFRPSDEISESSRSNTVEVTTTEPGPQLKKRQLNRVAEPASTTTANPIAPTPLPSKPVEDGRRNQEESLDDSFMLSDDFQDDDLIDVGNQAQAKDGKGQTDNVTFVTAKAANSKDVNEENVFDPNFQAQSIKHTVDQTTSKHIPASILKEKGLNGPRDSIYEKFAAKGKQLASPPRLANSGEARTPDTPTGTAQTNSPRFAPPSAVVRPNNASFLPPQRNNTRREVGRPKITPNIPQQQPAKKP